MSGSTAYRVETTSRLAQWRIDNLASTYRKSDPFKIGLWNWHLSVEKSRTVMIRLYPEVSNLTKENPPIASFAIKLVTLAAGDRNCFLHPDVTDKLLKSSEDFVWTVEAPMTGKFIIDIEFLDIKIGPPHGGEPCSIWNGVLGRRQSSDTALALLGRMLSEGIQTDTMISASDGSISAHRAVLASRSPVFRSMFLHDLNGVDISDMSTEACKALLNYIYGSIKEEEFLPHRLSLLHAADKYEIWDLKEACHDSLLEDIDTTNVLERLQKATLYQLPKLKTGCMLYLVKFGRIFDMRDDFRAFVQRADRELVAEIFDQVLGAWKGF